MNARCTPLNCFHSAHESGGDLKWTGINYSACNWVYFIVNEKLHECCYFFNGSIPSQSPFAWDIELCTQIVIRYDGGIIARTLFFRFSSCRWLCVPFTLCSQHRRCQFALSRSNMWITGLVRKQKQKCDKNYIMHEPWRWTKLFAWLTLCARYIRAFVIHTQNTKCQFMREKW